MFYSDLASHLIGIASSKLWQIIVINDTNSGSLHGIPTPKRQHFDLLLSDFSSHPIFLKFHTKSQNRHKQNCRNYQIQKLSGPFGWIKRKSEPCYDHLEKQTMIITLCITNVLKRAKTLMNSAAFCLWHFSNMILKRESILFGAASHYNGSIST